MLRKNSWQSQKSSSPWLSPCIEAYFFLFRCKSSGRSIHPCMKIVKGTQFLHFDSFLFLPNQNKLLMAKMRKFYMKKCDIFKLKVFLLKHSLESTAIHNREFPIWKQKWDFQKTSIMACPIHQHDFFHLINMIFPNSSTWILCPICNT